MKRSVARRKRTQRRSLLLRSIPALGGITLLALAGFALFGRGGEEFRPEVEGAAALRVDRDSVDLGNVPLGHTVRVAFEVSNVGDQTLRFAGAPYVEVVEGC